MIVIEDEDFLSQKSKDYISTMLDFENKFPYFYAPSSVTYNDNCEYFSHVFISRQNSPYLKVEYNSSYGGELVSFAHDFLKKHKIKLRKFLRGSINFTYYTGAEKSLVHRDHNFPHYQLLIYLNNPKDTTTATVIIDDDGTEHKVYPKQFKGVFFEDKEHYACLPQHGHRIVAVYTMLIEEDERFPKP